MAPGDGFYGAAPEPSMRQLDLWFGYNKRPSSSPIVTAESPQFVFLLKLLVVGDWLNSVVMSESQNE